MFDCSVDQEITEKDKTKTCTINANAPPVYFTREADEHTVNIKYTYSVVWIVSTSDTLSVYIHYIDSCEVTNQYDGLYKSDAMLGVFYHIIMRRQFG